MSETSAAKSSQVVVARNVQRADERLDALIEDHRIDISRGLGGTDALVNTLAELMKTFASDELRLTLALAVQRLAR
jgi:hypothetical protein